MNLIESAKLSDRSGTLRGTGKEEKSTNLSDPLYANISEFRAGRCTEVEVHAQQWMFKTIAEKSALSGPSIETELKYIGYVGHSKNKPTKTGKAFLRQLDGSGGKMHESNRHKVALIAIEKGWLEVPPLQTDVLTEVAIGSTRFSQSMRPEKEDYDPVYAIRRSQHERAAFAKDSKQALKKAIDSLQELSECLLIGKTFIVDPDEDLHRDFLFSGFPSLQVDLQILTSRFEQCKLVQSVLPPTLTFEDED